MKKKYGSIKPKADTMARFEKFALDLAAKRGKRMSNDGALAELLRRSGY